VGTKRGWKKIVRRTCFGEIELSDQRANLAANTCHKHISSPCVLFLLISVGLLVATMELNRYMACCLCLFVLVSCVIGTPSCVLGDGVPMVGAVSYEVMISWLHPHARSLYD
jgi:hypothetical protein